MKIVALLLFFPFSLFAQQPTCDILIRNGKIIDGTGNNWFYGDIAVKDGKIIGIGRQLNFSSIKTIDASAAGIKIICINWCCLSFVDFITNSTVWDNTQT